MDKILFVDDEQNILDSFKRNLRKLYTIDTAISGKAGLEILQENAPYAVVVSDMRMPEMDGIEFLTQVKNISPDTVRIMLTGNADMETAIDAVNQGNVYRFLVKPCAPEKLNEVLADALKKYREVVDLKESNEKLTTEASTDKLTGLPNRQNLQAVIEREKDRFARYKQDDDVNFSVVFIDLDNFKYYNDTHGHPVGDLLLVEFAKIIKKFVRKVDFPFRFGGDEFVILLPETDAKGAAIFAERIMDELEIQKQFQPLIEVLLGKKVDIPEKYKLSCSIGISSYKPGDKFDPQIMIKQADTALLSAKRAGKARFSFAD